MKLHFSLNYITVWGERLHVSIVYKGRDGSSHHYDLPMDTDDGQLWTLDTTAMEPRLSALESFTYLYKVEDADGMVLRSEWDAMLRTMLLDSTKDYFLLDSWRDVPLQKHLYTNAYLTPSRLPLFRRTVVFRVFAPQLLPGQSLGVCGAHPSMGAWSESRYLLMQCVGWQTWSLSINVAGVAQFPIEYKYVVVDDRTRGVVGWEGGDNRSTGDSSVPDGQVLVLDGGMLRVTGFVPPCCAHCPCMSGSQPPGGATALRGVKDYSTYIFDLDGTLLSTLDDLAASTNYALQTHSLPTRTIDEVRRFVGNGVKKLMERAVPNGLDKEQFDEIYATFRRHYLEHSLDTTRPYTGISETLAELKRRGKRIAVVSNKFYEATQELCKHFFGDSVEVAIGEREGIRKKPAPDTVEEALRQLGVGKDGAVYVGDSDVDVATARNCGLPCISVLWGFRDKDFLLQNGADTFITEPSQLLT